MASTFVDPELVSRALDLGQGDHLCLLYDADPFEQLPIILPFLRQGLDCGERCVYVADDLTVREVRQALSRFGVDVDDAERRGALLLWTREQWRPRNMLDSQSQEELVRGVIAEALACGFTGVRFGVEMTWTLGPDIDVDLLRHWEAKINTIFTPDTPARIICQYNRGRLTAEAIAAALATHPIAALGSDLCPNPFFEAPLILNGASFARTMPVPQKVEWMLSQLQWARTYDLERQRRVRAEEAAKDAETVRKLYRELKQTNRRLGESEEDLRDFFENGAVPLRWVGPDGTILRVNRAELELMGYREDEYVGRPISDFYEDPEVSAKVLARLHAGETLRNFEARLRCKDGSIRTVLIDASVLRRNGEFVHARCFTRDITEKLNTDEAISRLAAIVDNSDDAIVSKSLDGIIQSWNPAAERMFGYSAVEAVGRSIRLIIPEDRQAEEDEVLRRVRSGERVDHFETVRRRKDGSSVLISLTVSPVRDGQGRIIGASKIARDITDRKLAASAIQASEDKFRTLTRLAPVGIFLTDVNGDFLSVNDSWQALAGLSEEDALGAGWTTALHPDDRERISNLWYESASRAEDFAAEYRFQRPDGSITWLQCGTTPLRGGDGEVNGYIGTVTDITDLKKAQLAREEFLGLMSHELRTPITTVYGAARLLELRSNKIDQESRAELVTSIREEAERLNRMIENLLVMARLDANNPPEDEPVLIPRVVEEVVASFRGVHRAREVIVEVEPGVPLAVGHTGFVEHILQNLLSNAEKYSEPGTAITARVRREGDWVIVSVLDRGGGVEPGEEGLLFDQFYRSPRTASKAGGAGLGLTVCKRLVEVMRGNIGAAQREGGGLEVFFSLPALEQA